MSELILSEATIASRIFLVRGEKVLLDFDLASLYDVDTKNLKRAVKRNIERFPTDFMFQLSKQEYERLVNEDKSLTNKRSRYMPFAFTEQGVAMLSCVLNSSRAINVNIAIMRTFVQMRGFVNSNKEVFNELKKLQSSNEVKFTEYDKKIKLIFNLMERLIQQNDRSSEDQIGFYTNN